jgi:hypothetical protein
MSYQSLAAITGWSRYGPGQTVRNNTIPGDLVLTHREQLPSRLIAFGQRRRFRGPDRRFAHWSHVACVVGLNGELVEALGKGVEATHLERYTDVEFHYVATGAHPHDREQMARFLYACVGRPYGWSEILSLGLTLLTGGNFGFGNPGTMICSALAAQMLTRGDFVFPFDPNRAMPADIAKALQVRP